MPKKRKEVQEDMFTGEMVGADTSLFSGTAMKGHEEVFNPPSEVMRMDSMFGCNICHSTGWIKTKKSNKPVRCTCGASGNKFQVEIEELREYAEFLRDIPGGIGNVIDGLEEIAAKLERSG